VAFQYLASLIIGDEIRHHRMFKELASALRTDAEFRPEPPAIPRLDHWGPTTPDSSNSRPSFSTASMPTPTSYIAWFGN
jgi:hypothetical protein